jgi:hypothetical protein
MMPMLSPAMIPRSLRASAIAVASRLSFDLEKWTHWSPFLWNQPPKSERSQFVKNIEARDVN